MAGEVQVLIAEKAIADIELANQKVSDLIINLEKAANSKISFTTAADKETVSALKAEIDGLRTALTGIKETNTSAINIEKQLTKAKKDLVIALSAEGKELQQIRTQKNLVNAATRTEYKESVKLVNFYMEQNRIFNSLKKEYRDLALQKELNGQLSIKEEARLTSLVKKVKEYDAAFKKVDANMGVHGRNVGNYASAFDSLGFSVAQITRESPAFINSMNTGFMAISNNLPIFVDEVNKLVAANKVLQAEGKPTVNVIKKIGGAFLSWQSLISVGIVLLTLYGKDLVEWVGSLIKSTRAVDDAAAAQKRLNEIQTEGINNAGKEIAELQRLSTAVQDNTKSMSEREDILKMIRDKYGADIQYLTDREILTNGLTDAENDLTTAIIKRATADVAAEKAGEIIGKIIDLQLKRKKIIEETTKSSAIAAKAQGDFINMETSTYKAQDQMYKTAKVAQDAYIKNEKELITNSSELNDLYTQRDELIKIAAESVDSLIGSLGGAGKEEFTIFDNIEFDQKATEEAAKKWWADFSKKVKELTSQLDDVEFAPISDDAEIGLDSFRIAFFALTKDLGVDQEELMAEFLALYEEDFTNFDKFVNKKRKAAENEAKHRLRVEKQAAEQLLKYRQEVTDASLNLGHDLVDGLEELMIDRIEDEQERIEEQYDREHQNVEDSLATEEGKDKKLRLLKEEEEKRDKALEKKKKETERKAFLINQGIKVGEILMEMFRGIANANAMAPLTYGASLLWIPPIKATAAIGIAGVLAQSIPKFKYGSKGKLGRDTLGEWGHGEHEVATKDGRILGVSGKTPSLSVFPEGAEIHKNIPAFIDSVADYDNVEKAALMTSIQANTQVVEHLKDHFDYNLMSQVFEKAVKKMPKSITVPEMEEIMSDAMRDAISYNKYKF